MVDEAQPSQADRSATVSTKRYAVVVGVNDYSEAGIGNLSFCAADAEAFYDALLTYCEYDPKCVVLFSDGSHEDAQKPLRSNILAAIADMSSRATEEDSILFFFAGHGTRDARDSYLLTQEFRTSVVAETSIHMNMINDYLRQSKARFTMRFFDACHAGRIGTRAAPVGPPDIQKHFLVEAEGSATLSACKEDQLAHEDPGLGHCIFSYCLVKGLSGGAATAKQEVTFHSLTLYTITETSEITKELGLPQTPVSDGYQIGNLVLATMRTIPPAEVPPALVKVQETTIDQLKPTPEKIPQFVADIRATLQNDPLKLDFVAPSQKEKLAYGDKLVQKVYQWCQEQDHSYHDQLQDLVAITVKQQSIQACPLNLQLAEYIQDSKIKQAVALMLTYKTEQVPSKLWQMAFLGSRETIQVLNGISERQGEYETAVLLTISIKELLMPVCAMVVAIIPTAFGLYLIRYSCSTQLDQVQKEYWDPATFSVRTLHAIAFADKEGTQTLEELQELFPQLVSFLSESCSARRSYL
jgi:uncharacterized caspase-like protein